MLRTRRKANAKADGSAISKRFPIAGIGASAGGLESFIQLLNQLPCDTGLAVVFVQHLDPTHASLSTNIFSRATKMPVSEIRDGDQVKPNHIYVLPPNCGLVVQKGILKLQPRNASRQPHKPIDIFLKSLAEDKGALAIGVVLSGTATDGTEGLRSIKAEGGITFAQSPKSAKFEGMPQAAIQSGVVDLILPPHGIALELARIAKHPYVVPSQKSDSDKSDSKDGWNASGDSLDDVLTLLRAQTKIDFSEYKKSTLNRRIARRMIILKQPTQSDYAKFIKSHPEEARVLLSEILIHVTEFFRDPKSFAALKKKVFPNIVKAHDDGAPIRIWVPGCSTGEEAYSIAISLLDYFAEHKVSISMQIFASDVSELAIDIARRGFYSDARVKNIPTTMLKRYFAKCAGGYKINKDIRNHCVFSQHNVISDPPFAKVDLVSCRNLLIYFTTPLQRRAIPLFHYSLNPHGFLFLGHSESNAGFTNLFRDFDRAHKIYEKKAAPGIPRVHFVPRNYSTDKADGAGTKLLHPGLLDPQKESDRIVALKFGPSGVVVNSDLEILQFRGRTVPYLEQPSGNASHRLLRMAHPELAPELRTLLKAALKQPVSMRRDGIQVKNEGAVHRVSIEVIPLNPIATPKERQFLILFEKSLKGDSASGKSSKRLKVKGPLKTSQAEQRIRQLEQQLSASKEYQQSLSEDHGTAQEELNAANEELQSANEELQSTNEELETAKEELQSTNEELITVNDEMQIRNSDLNILNEKLLKAEELSRLGTEGIKDYALFTLDPNGRILTWNDGARRIKGYEAAEIIGRHFSIFYPSEDIQNGKPARELKEAIKMGRVEDTGWRVHKDGTKFWANVVIIPNIDKSGKLVGFSKITRDLTVQKQLETDRNLYLTKSDQSRLDAERANRTKDIFLATLSHELRTPLSSILTWAQLIRLGKVDFAKAKRGAAVIEENALAQSRLIDDLLDVSRVMSGKLILDVREINPRDAISAAVESVRPLSDRKSIAIKLSLSDKAGVIHADPIRLQQIVWNLLTNAIKFSRKGAKISIRLEYVGEPLVAQIKVIDQGKGIPTAFLPTIFDRFSQADDSSTRENGGLGLGLSIVRSLVELQNGTVRAENAPKGKGAIFTLTFPAVAPNALDSRSGRERLSESHIEDDDEPSLKDIRVLLVDDDARTRDAVAIYLKSFKAEVKVTKSARQAMAAIAKFKPHILISDIGMPGEDGYSLIQKIRASKGKRTRALPALALTAYASDDDAKRALAAGFQAHVAKPFKPVQLARAILKFTNGALRR